MRKKSAGIRFLIALLAGALALPSAAQAESQGYRFLEAVKKKDGEAVEKMLGSSGAKSAPGTIIVNTRDITTGDSALHIVIGQRNLQWLQYLLYNGADANIRNFAGTTPLWLAINTSFTEAVPVLLEKGARVNDPGPAGETPLIAAVHQKNLDMVRSLIKAGAIPTRADNSGRAPLDYARLSGAATIVAELEGAVKAATAKAAKSYGPSF